MQTIEIRYLLKILIAEVVTLTIIALVLNYVYLFSGFKTPSVYDKWIGIVRTFFIAYLIYIIIKKITDNKPVLVLTGRFPEIIEKGKPVALFWNEIGSFVIEKDYKGRHELILQTTQGEKKILNRS